MTPQQIDQIQALSMPGERCWVNWRLEQRDGRDTKVPYTPSNQRASSTDSATWSPLNEVIWAIDRFDGIGIVFTGSLLGIDLDHVIAEDSSVSKEIASFVEHASTYTEISPSGTGLHLYLRLSEPMELERNRSGNYECYTSGRYFTVTGMPWTISYPIRTVNPAEAVDLLQEIGYPWTKDVNTTVNVIPGNTPLADNELIERMFTSKNGVKIRALYDGDISAYGGDDSAADAALCSHLAFWTGGNAEQIERIWLASPLGAREKTQKRSDYRERTIAHAIESTTETYSSGKGISEASVSESSPVSRFHLWSIGDILSHDFGEEEWLVESLVSKQGVAAISGNPGDYKTWVTIHTALCVARGTSVFGQFPTTQGGVLIIDEEDHLRIVKGRLEMLGANGTDPIYYLSQSGFKADNEVALNAIVDIVTVKQIKLVILDSLVRIHDQEENDASGMAKVFSSIQKIIKAGASVLFTHHHRKQNGFGNNNNPGQNMRGSSDILAAVDSHVTLERKRGEEDILVAKQTKLRQGEALKPFEIVIRKSEYQGKSAPAGFDYVGEHDDRKAKAAEVATIIPLVLADGMKSRIEIHKGLENQFGKTAIDDGIKAAREAKDIERVPAHELPEGDRRKAYYRLPGASVTILDLPMLIHVDTEELEIPLDDTELQRIAMDPLA